MTTSSQRNVLLPFLAILSAVVFLSVVFVAVNSFQQRREALSTANQAALPSFTPTSTYPPIEAYFTPVVAPPVAPEEQWQVYTSKALELSLRHPPDWFFNEYREGGLDLVVFSTPINNPNPQNWFIGQLAGGIIVRTLLGSNESLDSYVQKLVTQKDSIWFNGTRGPSLRVGSKDGVTVEVPANSGSARYILVENDGYVYGFDFGMTYQSADSNYTMYSTTFEKVLSTVTFLR